jgi:hypothetical protein
MMAIFNQMVFSDDTEGGDTVSNKEEIKAWHERQEQKQRMLVLLDAFGVRKVLNAMSTLNSNNAIEISRFIIHQGCCSEA